MRRRETTREKLIKAQERNNWLWFAVWILGTIVLAQVFGLPI